MATIWSLRPMDDDNDYEDGLSDAWTFVSNVETNGASQNAAFCLALDAWLTEAERLEPSPELLTALNFCILNAESPYPLDGRAMEATCALVADFLLPSDLEPELDAEPQEDLLTDDLERLHLGAHRLGYGVVWAVARAANAPGCVDPVLSLEVDFTQMRGLLLRTVAHVRSRRRCHANVCADTVPFG